MEGLDQDDHLLVGVAAVHLGLRTPYIEVVGLEQTQAFFDVVRLVLDVAAFGTARTKRVYVGADKHPFASALKGGAVTEAFC